MKLHSITEFSKQIQGDNIAFNYIHSTMERLHPINLYDYSN